MSLCSDDRTLYISNLDKNVTDDVFYELFLQAGPVERVNIVASNLNSTNYGFVTYKHEASVEYAIQLFKETALFNKELSIKKKGKQTNDYGRNPGSEAVMPCTQGHSNLRQIPQGQFEKVPQNLRFSYNIDDSHITFSMRADILESNWSRNKLHDQGLRKHSSRSYEDRRRHKNRNSLNKDQGNRNKWYY